MKSSYQELIKITNKIVNSKKMQNILLVDFENSKEIKKELEGKNIEEITTLEIVKNKKSSKVDLIIINDENGDYLLDSKEIYDELNKVTENILIIKSDKQIKESEVYNLSEILKYLGKLKFFINHKYAEGDSNKRIMYFSKSTSIENAIIENEINLFTKEVKDNNLVNSNSTDLELAKVKIIKQEKMLESKENEAIDKSNVIKLLENTLHNERYNANLLQVNLNNIINSASWKITRPLRVSSRIVRKFFGMNTYKKKFIKYDGHVSNEVSINNLNKEKTVDSLIEEMIGHPTDLIKSLFLPNLKEKRLNIVIDSLNKNSLLGGVATALVVATEFAKKENITLRIITRNENINPMDYVNIMSILDVKTPNKVEYFSDYNRKNEENTKKLEIGNNDIFMATSWWSAKAIKKTSIRKKFYYIIQEIETYFYPHGDNHLEVKKIMNDTDIDFIVNSKYLWDYFCANEPNITNNGVYFNPVFSKKLYSPARMVEKGKKTLFFYARIQNPRNLFLTGIKLLDEGIKRGIINTKEWDICFAGQDTPSFTFCDGSSPKQLGLMDWKAYGEFLKTVDVALSLMYTPHPSYPPFDVAASGGVVLSNKCANKQKFIESDNVILSELDIESLVENLEKAMKLALNDKERQINFENNKICTNWDESLKDTLNFMENKYNV